jgi:hypothetical protein
MVAVGGPISARPPVDLAGWSGFYRTQLSKAWFSSGVGDVCALGGRDISRPLMVVTRTIQYLANSVLRLTASVIPLTQAIMVLGETDPRSGQVPPHAELRHLSPFFFVN